MKILQLGKFYPIRGGVEKVMWDLTKGLSAAGVHCDMLCASQEETGPIVLNQHGRVIRVKALSKSAGTMIAPGMISYLRHHKNEYDLIDVHHPDPMAALSLRLSGYRGPVVLHWHSDIIRQRFWLRLYEPLQRWLIHRADRIVGTTPPYIKASPYLQTVQSKCICIPIGIEPLSFEPAAAERLRVPDKITVLSVGRLVPYKGQEYLIEAAALLPDEFRIVIAGDGPLRENLKARIAALGLKSKVSLTGYVTDEELPALFGACDIFVLPSIMKTEAFGIVQLEAMSCSKPVIATDIPGSGTAWVAGSPLSIPPRNPEALAEAISSVATDRKRQGENALRRYETMFTLSQMINKTQKLYEEVISK